MMPELTSATQAILLLTAPLIVGRERATVEVLTPGEYKRLRAALHAGNRRVEDLLDGDSGSILDALGLDIDIARLRLLLSRGFLLSQALEQWNTRALWVLGHEDDDYPATLRERLGADAPPLLYGCGDASLFATPGFAVVGSRNADEALFNYTLELGRLAARSGRTVVSGGAKGIDQAAMRGALDAGGKAVGVLADGLERACMQRDHRDALMDGRLLLLSPFDPNAGFNVGNAMQRNKVIYALAEAALVVRADMNKGGTWNGATEWLRKYHHCPLFVREDESVPALAALRGKGALPWPEPLGIEEFEQALTATAAPPATADDGDLFSMTPLTPEKAARAGKRPAKSAEPALPYVGTAAAASAAASPPQVNDNVAHDPAARLFATVRALLMELLRTPRKDGELASALHVTPAQMKLWLQRLVDEGVLEKRGRPARYCLSRQTRLLH